jgi:hypothetical protein
MGGMGGRGVLLRAPHMHIFKKLNYKNVTKPKTTPVQKAWNTPKDFDKNLSKPSLSPPPPLPHSGLKIRKMCKNSSFHRNSTNSTLFKS